jgi:hypothetical protein
MGNTLTHTHTHIHTGVRADKMPRRKIPKIFYKYAYRRNKTQERLNVDGEISSVPKCEY